MTVNPAEAAAMFEAIRSGNDAAVYTAVADNEELLRTHDDMGMSAVVAAASAGHIRLAERLAARLIKSADGIGFFDAAAVGNVRATVRVTTPVPGAVRPTVRPVTVTVASRAIIGAALIGIISNGVVLMNINTYAQQSITGAVIIIAVSVDVLRNRRKGA